MRRDSALICDVFSGSVSDVAVRDAPGDGNVHMGSLSVKPQGRSQRQKNKIAENHDACVFSIGNYEPVQKRPRFVDSSKKCHRPLDGSTCVAKARSYVICLAGPCRTLRCGTASGDGNVHMGSLSVKPKGRSQWQKIKIAENRDAGVFSMGNVEPFSETRPIC